MLCGIAGVREAGQDVSLMEKANALLQESTEDVPGASTHTETPQQLAPPAAVRQQSHALLRAYLLIISA